MNRLFVLIGIFVSCLIMGLESHAFDGQIRHISIYGYGGDNPISEVYEKEAVELGKFLSENKIVPIFGCLSQTGNIYKVLESCVQNGGTVNGIINIMSHFPEDAPINGDITHINTYEGLKKELIEQANCLLILPCGIGGFAAALELLCLTEKKVMSHSIYFYNKEFWEPILTKLEYINGSLPSYKIIDSNNKSDIERIKEKSLPLYDKDKIDSFFEQQRKVRTNNFLSNYSKEDSKITLDLLCEILGILSARIEGLHNKKITLRGVKSTFQEDTISFGFSPWHWLEEILTKFYEEGFLKKEYTEMIQFETID